MEQNKGLKKKYIAPLVFDIGGSRINVVGATIKQCSAGSGARAACGAGSSGGTTQCAPGSTVYATCGTGGAVNTSQSCNVGLSAAKKCTGGVSAGTGCSAGEGFGG